MLLTAAGMFATSVEAAGVVKQCTQSNLLTALAGGGAVTFACSGTILLTQTLNITTNTNIDGMGKSVALSGGGAVPIFFVFPEVSLTLNRLVLENGNTALFGGAINNAGTVTVSNTTFRGNTAAFIGGAILNVGTLTVSNCLFYGNSALVSNGGAIVNDLIATVTNTTFILNTANSGGAIDNSTGNLQVVNSLFVDNIATDLGGAILNDATATVTNTAIIENIAAIGGGVDGDAGTLTVKNTIFVLNRHGNCAGFIVGSTNLSTDGSCPGSKAF
jgi:predicted outer membrane repeat protein